MALAAIAGFVGGRYSGHPEEPAHAPGAVIATYASGIVTVDDLHGHLDEGGLHLVERAKTVEGARALVDELVMRGVLASAAKAARLDAAPVVLQRQEALLADTYRERAVEAEVGRLTVSDAELAAAFEAERARLATPERVRVAYILVVKKDQARSVLAEVKKAMATSPDGFSTVARARSEDPRTQPFGGQLPYVTREELTARLGPAITEAVFAIREVGGLHDGTVEGADGHYVLRLLGREEARNPELVEVAPRLRERLLAAKQDAARTARLERLREAARVHVDEAALQRFVDGLRVSARRP
jgi:parvulin-like peptidyl-prolyl isomerase